MRSREGLLGGKARRQGDRMSTFLLPEGLHRMGRVGVSVTESELGGSPRRTATPRGSCVFPPPRAPRGAGGVAQGFLVRLPLPQPPTCPQASPGPEVAEGNLRHRHRPVTHMGPHARDSISRYLWSPFWAPPRMGA